MNGGGAVSAVSVGGVLASSNDRSNLPASLKAKQTASPTHTNNSLLHQILTIPDTCNDYTAYLKTITNDTRQPFLVDVNPVYSSKMLHFYITLSLNHLGYFLQELHTKYTLVFQDQVYDHSMKWVQFSGLLIFHVPVTTEYRSGDVVTFTLRNHVQNRVYRDVRACVKVPPTRTLPLVACSYVSNYNSMAELESYVAFQRVTNVSMVVLYRATPMPSLETTFADLIREGYVRVVDFTWPRPQRSFPQRCNQQAQMHSCYYRFKHDAEAIILNDVDEYVYSELYPFDLPRAVRAAHRHHPKFDVFYVRACGGRDV